MKITPIILISAIGLLTTVNASEYKTSINSSSYNKNIKIELYTKPDILPEEPLLPVANIADFVFPDGSTQIVGYGNTTRLVSVSNGVLPEGYSYWEYKTTRYGMVGVSSVASVSYSHGGQTSIYCSTGGIYGFGLSTGVSCNESDRMSILVKQPEGLVWYAKNGSWTRGATSSGILSQSSGFIANYADNTTLFPHIGSGSSGGSTGTLYFNPEDWLHYDNLMSWLEN
jgi:hypothetical protein